MSMRFQYYIVHQRFKDPVTSCVSRLKLITSSMLQFIRTSHDSKGATTGGRGVGGQDSNIFNDPQILDRTFNMRG